MSEFYGRDCDFLIIKVESKPPEQNVATGTSDLRRISNPSGTILSKSFSLNSISSDT